MEDEKTLKKPEIFDRSPLMTLMPDAVDLLSLESLLNSFYARYDFLKQEREKSSKLIEDDEERMLRTVVEWISGE